MAVEDRAVITVEVQARPGFTVREAVMETMFNFGIGMPEDGDQWMNMEGQAYTINWYRSTDGTVN